MHTHRERERERERGKRCFLHKLTNYSNIFKRGYRFVWKSLSLALISAISFSIPILLLFYVKFESLHLGTVFLHLFMKNYNIFNLFSFVNVS